jgi:hypothetical protein
MSSKLHDFRFYLLALAVGVVVALAGAALWTNAQATRQHAAAARDYAQQTRRLLVQVTADILANRAARLRTSFETCQRVNGLTVELRALIIGSAKASKPFERAYHQLGLPDYQARLRRADRLAGTLKLLNCRALKTH